MSPADPIAKVAESPAGKRLPPPRTCDGASGAGPASGVKATATALLVGRQTYRRPLYPWCKQDWLPHLQLEEVLRDYQNRALKLSLKCLQPQVVGYSQVSGCVDVVADKISGEAANPRKSPSLQRNKEEVSLCTNMMRKISLKKKLKRGAKVKTTRWDLSKRPAFLSPAHHSPRVGHSEGSSDDRVQHLCP